VDLTALSSQVCDASWPLEVICKPDATAADTLDVPLIVDAADVNQIRATLAPRSLSQHSILNHQLSEQESSETKEIQLWTILLQANKKA
jgi:hypothetical protein